MPLRWGFLYTLQCKLIIAFSALVIAALFLAGGIFVLFTQDEEEQRALDHTVAAAPNIYSGFLQRLFRGDSLQELESYVMEAAEQSDVRLLMFDESGRVVVDTGGDLTGEQLTIPSSSQTWRDLTPRNDRYESWQPEEGSPGSELIMVALFPPNRLQDEPVSAQPPPAQAEPVGRVFDIPYQLAVAVPESSIAGAWLRLLPGLLIAAGIALPVAIALAVIIARYVTRPLNRLTVAAHQMAQGTFDVDVSVDRQDEVGQLAQAFSSMATRVGEAHVQMRTLVANISHDMKTPLTSIFGFAQALRSGVAQTDVESRHMGEIMYEEAQRLAKRLSDLTYLSEIESGQAVLQCEEIDLQKLVDALVRRVLSDAESRGIRFSTDLGEGITISADGPKIERALENLLDNARKFTPPGGEIRIRTFLDQGKEEQVCIEVANSAPDIEAEELPRLFERLYRRDRAWTGRSAGTGLGLPIARDLIELHGGTLEASLRSGELILTAKMPRVQL